jgi:membrane dipeptidase
MKFAFLVCCSATLAAVVIIAGPAGCGAAPDLSAGPAAVAHRVLAQYPVVDGHNDFARHYLAATPPWPLSALDIEARLPGQSDVPRWRSGRIGATLVTVGSDLGPGATQHRGRLLAAVDWFDALARRHDDALMKALTPHDLAQAQASGRVAMIMAIESGDQLDGSLDQLRELHARGLRAITLVYDHHNALGDGAMVFGRSAEVARPPAGG